MDKVQKKILYIDDDRDDSLLLCQAIQPLSSIIVQLVNNGQEALKILEKDKLTGSLPSLIVIDMNMPLMNGRNTIETIKKDSQLKLIPLVIFTTAITRIDVVNLEGHNLETIIKPASWAAYKEIASWMLAYCECWKTK